MRMTWLASATYLGMLATLATAALANPDMEAASAGCREEAVSTGLEEEPDIVAYIDLCMQAWQTPDDYTAPDVSSDADAEVVPDETQQSDNPDSDTGEP